MSLPDSWGTTKAEEALAFPCDSEPLTPQAALYRGVSVDSAPATLFRWLCQLRVAPYSYDWIDNGGRQSPPALTPGLEQLEIGQTFMEIFRLSSFETGRHITLRIKGGSSAAALFGDVAVSYLVVPEARRSCRLLAKLLVGYPRGVFGCLMRAVLPWGDLVMMRRQLLNMKALAERSEAR